MQNTPNFVYIIRNVLKRFEKFRKKFVFLVNFFIYMNIPKQISVLKPYFQIILLQIPLSIFFNSPKEIQCFCVSIFFLYAVLSVLLK
jgi:hypothetical protein